MVLFSSEARTEMGSGVEIKRGGAAEPSSVSSTLLHQLRAGRPDAWRRLVDLYGPTVYRWSRQLGVGSSDAADVVQEVFCAVSVHLSQFRRDRPDDSFGGWLRTITRNKVCDFFRRRQDRPGAEGGTNAYRRLLDLAENPDPSTASVLLQPDSRFPRRLLDLIRVEFENRTWEVFERIVLEGQSPAEVAAALGLRLPAVYKAKSRVLRRLREELRDLLE
jgi:RNA polymerase sigma-70 factor, ECF subfamily